MKKLSTIIMAMALVLGLAQCKKQEISTSTTTPDVPEGMVHITVNVDDNGGKHVVFPEYGLFAFDAGDILYVGNNNHYIGYLQYYNDADGRRFEGYINPTNTSTSDKLHFYFLGGKGPAISGLTNETTNFNIDISDQASKLPILCYGTSSQDWSGTSGPYSTTLRNKCALVKFSTNVASRTVNVDGMNTVATVNFGTGEITSGTPDKIKFTTDNTGKGWAILLEQGTVDANVTAVGYAGTCSVPAITNNMYYTQGVSVNLTELEVLTSGNKNNVHYVLYSDYTLYLSGTGNVPADAFGYYYFSNAKDVKKIIFDDACTISSIDFEAFRPAPSQYSQLTDVEINTTVPLAISASAIEYAKGVQDPVNFTITAPLVTFPKHESSTAPFHDYNHGPLNIVFNMSAPITFETYTFNTLTSADAVTIPAGCFYRVTSYQFTDSYYQRQYERFVEMGDEDMFWDMYGNNLVEGEDYTVTTSSVEITSSNASTVFGSATVTII